MIELPFHYLSDTGLPVQSRFTITPPVQQAPDLFACSISAPELNGAHACEGVTPVESLANACVFIQAYLAAPNTRVRQVAWGSR